MSKTNDKTDRRKAKLARKMDLYGAQTPLQYRLFRIRAAWRRVLSAMGPRAVLALARRKRYPQIASLGVNCEVAFRFYCRWGFVDSSVFAWAASQNLATIEAALRNLRSVHEGSFSMNERTHMWMNADCGINFHGNLKWKPDSPTPPREALDEDLAELRGRLRHLTEKLVRYLRSDEETLPRFAREDARRHGGEELHAPGGLPGRGHAQDAASFAHARLQERQGVQFSPQGHVEGARRSGRMGRALLRVRP